MYALKLAEDGRVLSVMDKRYQTENTPMVDSYPDDDPYKYRYVDGQWIYDPIAPPRTAQDDIDEMLIDIQYRLTLLELGIEE